MQWVDPAVMELAARALELERAPVAEPELGRVLALEFVTVPATEPIPEYVTEQARGLAPAQEREAAIAGVDANRLK